MDKRIGMVHNGTIDEAEFLSTKYQCISETDSEVLLRIFEQGLEADKMNVPSVPNPIAQRLTGIRDIWATITEGAMAVALGERDVNGHRNLFLFRNDKRPLWLADLRNGLGQIFFFSSPDIWYRAMAASTEGVKATVKDQKLFEIPPNEVWVLQIDDKKPHVTSQGQMYRFALDVKETGKDWDEDTFYTTKAPKESLSIISELNDSEEVAGSNLEKLPIIKKVVQKHFKTRKPNNEYEDPYDMRYAQGGTEHEAICDAIAKLAQDISTTATNACLERTLGVEEYNDMLASLESTKVDLLGTLRLVGG
jgi:glucosamine 6-phosphate synthetase-like amidotransferase/phosphosugar isomerase protein